MKNGCQGIASSFPTVEMRGGGTGCWSIMAPSPIEVESFPGRAVDDKNGDGRKTLERAHEHGPVSQGRSSQFSFSLPSRPECGLFFTF